MGRSESATGKGKMPSRVKVRTSPRTVVKPKCTAGKKCTDWECFFKYTYDKIEFVKLQALQGVDPNTQSYYATNHEVPRRTEYFMSRYSIQASYANNRTKWWHSGDESQKFSSLDNCFFAWYNFPKRFPVFEDK